MKFYIIKKGMYLQGIYGPYDSELEAIKAFEKAYDTYKPPIKPSYDNWNEFDGYHNYYIIEGLQDKIGQPFDRSKIKDRELKYIAKRNK